MAAAAILDFLQFHFRFSFFRISRYVKEVKVRHFPFKRYMAYNNLHCTTVHAVITLSNVCVRRVPCDAAYASCLLVDPSVAD
jgi:hypothetical protein